MRGQMDKNLVFAANVALSGANEVSPVTTTATGNAYLRLADDNTLISKVVVSDLESNDTLLLSHVHSAASGRKRRVIIDLCHTAADFGATRTSSITSDQAAMLLNDPVYVNVHSKRHPGGIIRGQIR
jgi:hypothetical protein